jgi:AmmeMemoRadiSam system protein B
MKNTMNPRLRPIEINAVEEDGEKFFVLQDQQQLSSESLVVSPTGAWLLQHLNGEKSSEEIRDAFERETGNELPVEMLENLLEALDENYLLENERSRKRRESVIENFRDRSVREPTLPGQSVPQDEDELRSFLDETLPEAEVEPTETARGLVMPHIDFFRGKETYARTVPYLKNLDDVDRIVMLGISHHACSVPFSLTKKTFKTPFNKVETDPEALEFIEDSLPYDLPEGEAAHRLEHSIEIPLLLMQYANPSTEFDIVPVICSFGNDEEHPELLESMVDSLKTLLDDAGTHLIAGVDFAHMGPEFGDPEPLDEDDYESIETHDRSMIESLTDAEKEQFEHHIQSDHNRRRVCGYPALRTILPLFDSGELIHYDQWQDPRETVTYGSLVMQ